MTAGHASERILWPIRGQCLGIYGYKQTEGGPTWPPPLDLNSTGKTESERHRTYMNMTNRKVFKLLKKRMISAKKKKQKIKQKKRKQAWIMESNFASVVLDNAKAKDKYYWRRSTWFVF